MMNRIQKLRAIGYLKEWAVQVSGCYVQVNDWPCGTCLLAALEQLGVKEDGQHNKKMDRSNEVWRAILQIRDTEIKLRKKKKGDRHGSRCVGRVSNRRSGGSRVAGVKDSKKNKKKAVKGRRKKHGN